jgi:hypothetical protein
MCICWLLYLLVKFLLSLPSLLVVLIPPTLVIIVIKSDCFGLQNKTSFTTVFVRIQQCLFRRESVRDNIFEAEVRLTLRSRIFYWDSESCVIEIQLVVSEIQEKYLRRMLSFYAQFAHVPRKGLIPQPHTTAYIDYLQWKWYAISQGYEILIAMADEAQDWGQRLGESYRQTEKYHRQCHGLCLGLPTVCVLNLFTW